MNELFWKMQKHDIKLVTEAATDECGHDCVIFAFNSPIDCNGKRKGISTIFYLDRVTSNPGFVFQRLNEILDKFIDREIQHNLNQ